MIAVHVEVGDVIGAHDVLCQMPRDNRHVRKNRKKTHTCLCGGDCQEIEIDGHECGV